MERKRNFRIGTALLLALSVLGIAPAASAGERRDRYDYSYDRGYRAPAYPAYGYGYREPAPVYRDYGYGYGYDDHRYRRAERSVAVIGGSAAAGAVVGGIAGGGRGAAVGALIGGIGGLIINQATQHHHH